MPNLQQEQQTGITLPHLAPNIYSQTDFDLLILSGNDIQLELINFLKIYYSKDTIFSLVSLIFSLIGLLTSDCEGCKFFGLEYNNIKILFIFALVGSALYLLIITIKKICYWNDSKPEYFVHNLRGKCKKLQ